MDNIICVCNPKGGTGKTTTAICLAEALARDDKKVLIIDMDQLGTVSMYFLENRDIKRLINHGVTDGIVDSPEPDSIIQYTSNKMIDIIPLENVLRSDLSYPIKENNLLNNTITSSAALYDFCIIDTSRPYMRFGIAISHNLLITVSDYVPLDGIKYLMDLLATLNDSDREDCKIRGVLLTRYDNRLNIKRKLKQLLSYRFGELLLENTIPSDINIQKSQIQSISIFEYSPKSPAAVAYLKAAEEFHGKMEGLKWMDLNG